MTFFIYGVSSLVTLIFYMLINRFTSDTEPPPNDVQWIDNGDPMSPQNQHPHINVAANPLALIDTKNYYQASQSGNPSPSGDTAGINGDKPLNTVTKSSFPIAPHGVPSTNPNWSKQFDGGKNY